MSDSSCNTAEVNLIKEATMDDELARSGQGKRRHSLSPPLSPAKRRFHSSFVDEEQIGQGFIVSADPPPYFTAMAENNLRSSADIFSYISELDLEAAFKTENMSEYTPETGKLNHSMENSDPLGSGHARSQENYWTGYVNLGRLVLILTGLLLLNTTLTSFFIREFIFVPGQSSHQEGICLPGNYTTQKSFAIDPESGFIFSQEVRSSLEGGSLLADVHVDGEIHIKPATEALDSSIRVDVVSYTSDPELIHFEAAEGPNSSLILILPSSFSIDHVDNGRRESCVHAHIIVWVRPGTILPNFKIWTQSLSIILHPGLQYRVEGQVELGSMHGSIESLPSESSTSIYSREFIIHTASGSVKGAYPLYDLLSITTLSGSIDVSIDLKEASTKAPKPAKLLLKTLSGAVRVNTPLLTSPYTVVPFRDYQSDIHSLSSSVDITIPHGSISTLRSQSGSLSAALHPCGDPAIRSDLTSHVASGATHLTIHRSRTHPTSPLRNFYASHHQQSGSLRLHYPAQWEGHITGETMSGAIRIDWPGVNIISDDRRRIQATRGTGDGRLEFSTLSGSVDLSGER